MIELVDVGVSYSGRALFSDVSLELPAGSFHFLTGPSGAGKTSLIRLCSLERSPSEGRVRLLGQETGQLGRNDVASMRRRIGVVHQDSQFIDHLTVAENVLLPLKVSANPTSQAEENLGQLLNWVGLNAQAANLPPELSGGERQRAALARAVITSPEIILADEPTGNVDWDMSLRLLDLLVELNRLGKTILCATHDMNLIRQAKTKVQTRVLRIRGGEVALAGSGL